MKMVSLLSIIFVSSMAFAQGQHEAGHPSAPSAEVTSASSAKMTKKEAKAQCKAEGQKGKALKQCIRKKTK